jgi:hypothetical protein
MITRTKMILLLERLGRQKIPSHRLDADIFRAVGAFVEPLEMPHPVIKGATMRFMVWQGQRQAVWPLTGLADAAFKLIDDVRPGCCPMLLRFPNGQWGAAISGAEDVPQIGGHEAATAPLALLCALIEAIIADNQLTDLPAATNEPGTA